jgi:hypothetical protein
MFYSFKTYCLCGVLLVLSTTLLAQRFSHSFGTSFTALGFKQYKYTNTLRNRAPYEVVSPHYYRHFITVNYRPAFALAEFDNSHSAVSIVLPIALSAFAQVSNNTAINNGKSFLLAVVPVQIEYGFGHKSSKNTITENGLGGFISAGGSAIFTAGSLYNSVTLAPYASVGVRKQWGKRTYELSLGKTINFIGQSPYPVEPFGPSKYTVDNLSLHISL